MPNWIESAAAAADDAPAGVYQAFLEDGLFALRCCHECGRPHYPPRVVCPSCGSTSLGWIESAGRGEVYSVSVVEPRDGDPYAVALVDLEEGPRLMTNVVDVDPDAVAIGSPVEVRIGVREGQAAPLFVLAAATGRRPAEAYRRSSRDRRRSR